jgi:cell division protein FtsB
MLISHDLKARARHGATPVIVASILAYFAYHAVEGNHGLFARSHLLQEISVVEKKAALIHDQRLRLERRVALLRPDNLDPDLLSEEARRSLGYANPDDVIILTPDKKTPSKHK